MQHYSFTSSVSTLNACAPLPPSCLIKSSTDTPFNGNYVTLPRPRLIYNKQCSDSDVPFTPKKSTKKTVHFGKYVTLFPNDNGCLYSDGDRSYSIVNELRLAEYLHPMRPTAPRGTSASLSPFQKALLAIHRPDLGLFVGSIEDGEIVEIEDEDENELQEGGHAGQEPEPDLSGSQYDPQFDMDDPLSYYMYEEHDEDVCD